LLCNHTSVEYSFNAAHHCWAAAERPKLRGAAGPAAVVARLLTCSPPATPPQLPGPVATDDVCCGSRSIDFDQFFRSVLCSELASPHSLSLIDEPRVGLVARPSPAHTAVDRDLDYLFVFSLVLCVSVLTFVCTPYTIYSFIHSNL